MKRLIEVDFELSVACSAALDKWGRSAQFIQAMGECGELTASIVRHFQGRDPDLDEVTKEAADVVILMMQIRELDPRKFDTALAEKFKKFTSKVEE